MCVKHLPVPGELEVDVQPHLVTALTATADHLPAEIIGERPIHRPDPISGGRIVDPALPCPAVPSLAVRRT